MRDIGDKKFERHFHFMVATTRINRDHLIKIRSKRENNKTKIVLCKNINAFINYLVKKEIYAGTKKRSYGSSQFFKKQIEMDYMHIK